MTRAVIVGSGSEIAPTRVTNAQMARIMDTSDEWIRERSGVEQRYFASPEHRHLRPRRGRGREGARDGRRRQGGGRPGGLRHHDPRPLLPRLRHAPAAQAGPARRSPASTSASSARASSTACSSRTRTIRAGLAEDRAARRRRGPHRLHALDAGELRLRATATSRRAADEGGVRLELALPAPGGALRRRGRGGGAAGGRGRRARRPRPRAARRRAPTTRSSTCPAPASSTAPTPTPSSSSAATTSRSWTAATSSRWPPRSMVEVAQAVLEKNGVAPERPEAGAHAPGQQAHQRVLREGARAARRAGRPQHPQVRQHHRRHDPAALGRVRARRAARSPATWC